jgi:alpha-beta hydrolase superfamily lysophospholipase
VNPPAQPRYFGPADRPLFGWLHLPALARDVGVVLCSPAGYEAICTHRTFRTFAEQAAARGFPALRFDYDGTGDSSGKPTDPERVAHWLRSIGAAIDELKARTGVKRVCLFGLRVGATLATLVACERDDIDALIAFAPVVRASAWLREIRALALSRPTPVPPAGLVIEPEIEEAAGFTTTEETRTALAKINLLDLDAPPARRVLLLERDDMTRNDVWSKRLQSQGVLVEQRSLEGYADMMRDAHASKVPVRSIDAALDWLSASTDAPSHEMTAMSDAPSARIGDGASVRESAQWLDPGRVLFGIVSEPAAGAPARDVVVLLNSGTIHHVGPGRLYVSIARECAQRGIAAIRIDLSGVGDSGVRPGEVVNTPYAASAAVDVQEAVAFAHQRFPGAQVHLVGLCSGAYHGLKGAIAGAGLTSVVMVNPLTFFWKPGMSLDYADFQVTSESNRYARSAATLSSWLKLLRGQVDIVNAAKVLSKRAIARGRNAGRDLARLLGARVRDDLASDLLSVARQHTDMYFVFSASDPGHSMLREQGGRIVGRLGRKGQLRIAIVEGADHTFTSHWNRDQLVALLMGHLDRHAARR